jgi:hypothetical protein
VNHNPATDLPGKNVRRTYKPTLDFDNPPPRVDRQAAAALLYARLGLRISPRTLEAWPLVTRLLNGRATYDTAELLAHGHAMLDGSPGVRGGRTRKAA